MPTWLIERGYSFRVYSVDCLEPAHVHVRGHGGRGKIWLAPVRVGHLRGYNRQERATIFMIVANHHEMLLERWDAFCDQQTGEH